MSKTDQGARADMAELLWLVRRVDKEIDHVRKWADTR